MSVAKDNVIKCPTIKTNLPLQEIPVKCQAPIRLREEEHTNPDINTMDSVVTWTLQTMIYALGHVKIL